MVFRLDSEISFPHPSLGEPDGLLAIGGDLSVDRLLLAYHHGIFPWYPFAEGPIQWWCPQERFVILPRELHISHSLRSLMRKGRYRATTNAAFDRVVTHCAEANNRHQLEGAWLGDEMKAAYGEVHRLGVAHSIEVWEGDALVGGLYGVMVNRVFAGESMFSLVPSGSKLALVQLSRLLERMGDCLIDCQFETPHLRSMGGRTMSYADYMAYHTLDQ